MPAAVPTMSAPALEITNLRCRYPGGAADDQSWIVDLASLRLAAAEQVLLTGGSRVGKSTLLQLIAGLMEPSEGRINVAGRHMHVAPPFDPAQPTLTHQPSDLIDRLGPQRDRTQTRPDQVHAMRSRSAAPTG